jgi:predicted nucleic acid-binding protein
MGTRYLLDTNIVIDFSAQKLPATAYDQLTTIIDTLPQISIINKIELLSFSHVPKQIITFTDAAHVFALDEPVIAKTIELRKKYRIKLPDAIIAATAIVHELTLITRNTPDFKSINGLKLLSPWQQEG